MDHFPWNQSTQRQDLQSMGKAVETLPEKKNLFCSTRVFQSPIFTFPPTLPFSMLWPRQCPRIGAYFNVEKRMRRGKDFFSITEGRSCIYAKLQTNDLMFRLEILNPYWLPMSSLFF